MKKLFIYFIVFIGIGISLSAQEKSNKEKKGDKYTFSYSFDKAIDSYTDAKNLSIDGQRRLAEAYHKIDQNIQSEEAYLKLISSPEGILPEDYFNYAMVLKINGKYDEANKWMDKFIELKPDDLRAKDYLANKNELTDLLKDAGKYKIVHLDINTDAEDFGPCYLKNKIVFASSRTDAKLKVKKYNWTRKPFWDMYVSEVDGGQLKTPEIFDMGLNGKLNDGPASFSNNDTHMAFTRNHYHDKSKDRVVELQIYFSDFKEGKWTKPEPFFLNKEEYSVGQPCLTSDGNTMYFTSDMPGGYGKADIYRITKDEKGEWGKPENLGNKINTEGDEMYPFFEENNKTLFFSSNGRFGLGGLDIFSCRRLESGFGRVYNAGAPLNTQYDDFATIVNEKKSNGFFTSNRVGGSGGDDLYSFTFAEPNVLFSVIAPIVIPDERRVREYFPLRNYIFFNLGSTEIPDRYVLLRKDQVKDFKEAQLEIFTPKEVSGRSKRQLVVYYNVLNILGDRMGKNPLATIKLVGSSEKGPEDGKEMALSVMRYLTRVFGIDDRRISMEGRYKPKIPSEQPGGILELALLREGDRRVSVESSSPELLMEFQSGPEAPLKPVEIIGVQETPLESYVSFNVEGAKEALSSWSLEIMDETGKIKYFGPYSQEKAAIPGKALLGVRPEGDFTAKMIGQTKGGKTTTKEAPLHLVLWSPSKTVELMRFSIIYEFDDSSSILIYEKYLTDIVTPKIPKDGKIIIHGYTDIIGEENHNLELSLARANDVKNIFEKALSKVGRNDVKIEVYGFGEDENLSQFNNKYPEERFYNRTVIIDIVPAILEKPE
jgi:outer membrane protein OmpA-like peptidoglycan-associated protein